MFKLQLGIHRRCRLKPEHRERLLGEALPKPFNSTMCLMFDVAIFVSYIGLVDHGNALVM